MNQEPKLTSPYMPGFGAWEEFQKTGSIPKPESAGPTTRTPADFRRLAAIKRNLQKRANRLQQAQPKLDKSDLERRRTINLREMGKPPQNPL